MYKYILAAVLSFAVTTPALAGPKHHDYYRSYNHHNHRSSGKWVAPLIGGIVLGAIISDAKAKERENNRKIIVVKEPQRHCEELTIIVQNRWGDILDRRTEYRCTEY